MRAWLFALMIGCVPSGGDLRSPVDADLARRLRSDARIGVDDDAAVARAVADRLAKPLDKDAAVRIALANSARLRASLAGLGVAGAALALGLGPTEIEATAKFGGGGHEVEVDVTQDLLALISAPLRRSAGRHELAAATATATATALRLVARVERAFHDLLETRRAHAGIPDLRIAAFVNAIHKVARSYMELGIFP